MSFFDDTTTPDFEDELNDGLGDFRDTELEGFDIRGDGEDDLLGGDPIETDTDDFYYGKDDDSI